MIKKTKRANMAAAKKQPKTSFTLAHPGHYFFTGYVNRYCIIREEDFTLCLFGLVGGENRLLEKWGYVVPDGALEALKENLVGYSDQVGSPKSKPPKWTLSSDEIERIGNFPIIDFIHLCNWADAYAEMCFWNYSRAKASDLQFEGRGARMEPWGAALIRCSLDLQRAFLEELYPE